MIPILSLQECLDKISQRKYPAQSSYRAFYSSWWGGIVKDPVFFILPIDDHMVHRGDGVFEALKFINGRCFLLKEHLQRLFTSAQKIGLTSPQWNEESIKKVILETIQASSLSQGLVRLYFSRGPGHFSANPYDSIEAQLYVVITDLTIPSAEKYEKGASLKVSKIPVKDSFLAQIKSCNYLINVLMKKEAVDAKVDFTIGVDERGFVTESSTENVMLLDSENRLCHPPLEIILRGTTLMRTFQLAQSLIASGEIAGCMEKQLTLDDFKSAKEIMIVGTTWDVLPVGNFEGQVYSERKISKKLLELLRDDMMAKS